MLWSLESVSGLVVEKNKWISKAFSLLPNKMKKKKKGSSSHLKSDGWRNPTKNKFPLTSHFSCRDWFRLCSEKNPAENCINVCLWETPFYSFGVWAKHYLHKQGTLGPVFLACIARVDDNESLSPTGSLLRALYNAKNVVSPARDSKSLAWCRWGAHPSKHFETDRAQQIQQILREKCTNINEGW